MLMSAGFYTIGASPLVWHTAIFDVCVKKSSVGKWELMGQPSRRRQVLYTGRESPKDTQERKVKDNWGIATTPQPTGWPPSSER